MPLEFVKIERAAAIVSSLNDLDCGLLIQSALKLIHPRSQQIVIASSTDIPANLASRSTALNANSVTGLFFLVINHSDNKTGDKGGMYLLVFGL